EIGMLTTRFSPPPSLAPSGRLAESSDGERSGVEMIRLCPPTSSLDRAEPAEVLHNRSCAYKRRTHDY
ncbi:hypothetical protein PFISCL1PPCAC_21249, partial [Pristionchus fissidentatus]